MRSRRISAHDVIVSPASPAVSPIELDGWIEWNCEKWNLRPLTIQVHDHAPCVEMKCFLDRHRQIFMPPLAPYLPVAFRATPTEVQQKISRQWLEISELLVAEISQIGLANFLLLPAEVTDVRAWQWAEYPVLLRYTYFLDFPYELQAVDRSVRNRCNHAAREYTCRRADNMNDVVHCLKGTTERHHLPSRLSGFDLERAVELMGDSFRAYVCYGPNAVPVSTQIALFAPGARALDWLAGTDSAYLTSGVAQLLTLYMLDDLQAAGASGIDFVGANVRGVAIAKSKWGGSLVPFFRIETPGIRRVLQAAGEWVRFSRHARKEKVQPGTGVAGSADRP
jgi:hypothetical protein